MRRRDFIAGLGGAGAASAWPSIARAQSGERMRRIGMLMAVSADDPESPARIETLRQRLEQLGWAEGKNFQLEVRWTEGDAERIRKEAVEMASRSPDVMLVNNATIAAALRATRTVPIVFTFVTDPVGAGIVESLSHPGGNATGFMQFEYSLSAKWLELLKEISPSVTRAAVLRDAGIAGGIGQFAVIQSVAPSVGIDVSPVNVRDASEIERAITSFARQPNGGVVVTASALAVNHRDLIIKLAARYKLPAIYHRRIYVDDGGLISYGPNLLDQYRHAAEYIDRILKGEKPADLPVQAPNKYELIINLKTAKSFGIKMPAALLARADEVIE